ASFARRSDPDCAAAQADGSRVRVVVPVQDFHQRALAGSVFSEHRMDFATKDIEVDVVVGEDTREALRNSAQGQVSDVPPLLTGYRLRRRGWGVYCQLTGHTISSRRL